MRSNETWLADLRGGGPEQQAALRDLRAALLRGLRKALSGYSQANEALLEDAVQDALLRILDRLGQFEGRSRFVTWATSIAVRIAMSELRRRRFKDVSLDELVAEGAGGVPPGLADEGSELSALPERRDLVDTMYAVIGRQLTQRQRAALLAELRGMPQAEIARHLGSNRNAVYKLIHDARKRLKHGLEAAGYQGADVQAAFSG